MKNKREIIIIIGAMMIVFSICIYLIIDRNKKNNLNDDEEINDTSSIDTSLNTDDGDSKIIWSNYESREIVLEKSITINEGGIYNLSGKIEDGYITVDTNEDVKLVLNNVSITNTKGPCIYVKKANNTVIYLEDGTTNTLTDGSNYSFDDGANGVIYSKDDLIFDGLGTLIINASFEDGIVSKDDLKIINGNFIIKSKDDAIRGKDSVYILDGNFDIAASGDGIKSSNDTESDKGFIKIENGTFKIVSELDAIQAETVILIENGIFNIETGGGSKNVSTSNNWGNWGRKPNVSTTSTESAKGLKAGDNLVVESGNFIFDTSDDAIHSNNYVGIKDGNIDISSGDDGIHADKEIIIDGGKIDIKKSYEGIEAAKVTINDGNINIVSTDDGINVAGGKDASSMGGRPGQNNFGEMANNILTINGGTIYVNASGDGIDVNGSGYVYGGNIVVDGPTDNGNGALDYDGEFIVNGGTLLAGGSSGMAQGASSNSTQFNVSIFFEKTLSSDTKVSITDEVDNEIIIYSGSKNFSSLIISSDKLSKLAYKIKINDEEYTTFTISSITTKVGNSMEFGPGGMPNGLPGGMGIPGGIGNEGMTKPNDMNRPGVMQRPERG